jgi:histidine triad (HIT) family protein
LFCEIAQGQSPAHIIFRDESICVFLDLNPIRPGHTQIVPREHYVYFDTLPPELACSIVQLGQRVARAQTAIQRAARRLSVHGRPHVHAHVVPLIASDDITSRRYIREEHVTYQDAPPPARRVADNRR